MKKVFRIMGLCALVALAATSCKKDEQKLTSSFTAELTQPTGEAKTHLGSDSYLYWDNGDAIKVFDNAGTAYLLATTDNNVKVATFTSEATLDANESYAAFYPAAGTVLSGTEILLELPATQIYAEGTFGNATYPMAAVNNGTSFTFHSPCGLLAIPVKGSGNIGSIELTGKANENLAGQLRYNLNGAYQSLANGQTTVTLDCGNIALDATNATTFYFVVPAGVFANGFTAVIKNGTTELYTLETTRDNNIAAENIRLMPEVTVESITVTTIQTDNVGWTGACLYGSYVAPTGMSVTEYGFYWGADVNPTTKVVGEPDAENPLKFEKFLLGLTEGTTYYYKAYVKNGENEYVGEVKNFTTTVQVGIPSVTTSDVVTNITATGAVCGGTVTDLGNNGTLEAYGIKYSTDANMSSGVVDVAGTDYDEASGNFIATLTGLTGNTTYYYRAYVTNQSYNNLGEIMSFTTTNSFVAPTVTNGTAAVTSATTATAHVTLDNAGTGPVTEIGVCWGTANPPQVNPSANNFAAATGHEVGTEYTVNIEGLTPETFYFVTGYAKVGDDYYYAYSGSSQYFTTPAEVSNSSGFTVSSDKRVLFATGNLQYTKSTGEWSFMAHQYDMVETQDQNVGTNYGDQDVISLFSWGASGYNHGASYYQPWKTTYTYNYNYYKAYGDASAHLYSQTGKADWGYNVIHGGDETYLENSWRTLTLDEWYYVFNTRETPSGIRFVNAQIEGTANGTVKGVILLPDNWDATFYTLNNPNDDQFGGYDVNPISVTDWVSVFEANGAVFLPVAGGRNNTSTFGVGDYGYYWSSSASGSTGYAWNIRLGDYGFYSASDRLYKAYGCSVRLVRDIDE